MYISLRHSQETSMMNTNHENRLWHQRKHRMTAQTRTTRRMNVAFPTDLLTLLDSLVPPRERNRFIVEATERSLHQARLRKALAKLRERPAWPDEDHPELTAAEDVDCYIRRLRENWMPHTWDAGIGDAAQETNTQRQEARQGD